VNHAINAGDMLSLIASELHSRPVRARAKIIARFEEVMEGQFLDFELSEVSAFGRAIDEERPLVVNKKKHGRAYAAAAECAVSRRAEC